MDLPHAEITYEFVPKKHFLIYFTHLGGSPRIGYCSKDWRYDSVVAKVGDEIVGVCGASRLREGVYESYGTFVNPDYRGRNIGVELWKVFLQNNKDVSQLKMSLISDHGEKLAMKLVATLPVKFILTFQNKPNYKPAWAYEYEQKVLQC